MNTVFTKTLLLAATMLFSLTSCFRHYYDTRALTTVNEQQVTLLQDTGKTVLIHFADRPMLARIISLRDGLLEGSVTALPEDKEPEPLVKHTVGLHKEHRRQMAAVVAQVHVFAHNVHSPANEALVLPLVDVQEIQYQKYNAGMSVLSHAAGFAGIALAILATAGVVVAASGGIIGPITLNGLGL